MHEKIIRINISRDEIYLNILKSVSQNNNLHNGIKNYSNYMMNKRTKKNFFLSRKHKICLYTGKRSSILNNLNFSRYTVKSLILQNKFTNFKKNNW